MTSVRQGVRAPPAAAKRGAPAFALAAFLAFITCKCKCFALLRARKECCAAARGGAGGLHKPIAPGHAGAARLLRDAGEDGAARCEVELFGEMGEALLLGAPVEGAPQSAEDLDWVMGRSILERLRWT